jgi:DNA-directed RNA polymerase II subunit RPB7
VQLPPAQFGQNIREKVIEMLKAKVEGKCTGRFGYTIIVCKVENVTKGKLHPVTGMGHFHVRYNALVFKPYKNEILQAEVTGVNEEGFWCSAGPLAIYISGSNIPKHFVYEASSKSYVSKDEERRITQGSDCRIKILGVLLSATNMKVVGTIKDSDYLGPYAEEE